LENLRLAPRCCERWGRLVVARPWLCLWIGLAILAFLALPAYRLNIASVEAKNIPAQSDSRKGYESLAQNLGKGWMMPAIILVQHPDDTWMGSDGLAQEKSLVDSLAQLPNTEKILTVTDSSGSKLAQQTRMGLLTSINDPTQSVILMLSHEDPQSPTARLWLDRITALLAQAEKDAPKGTCLLYTSRCV